MVEMPNTPESPVSAAAASARLTEEVRITIEGEAEHKRIRSSFARTLSNRNVRPVRVPNLCFIRKILRVRRNALHPQTLYRHTNEERLARQLADLHENFIASPGPDYKIPPSCIKCRGIYWIPRTTLSLSTATERQTQLPATPRTITTPRRATTPRQTGRSRPGSKRSSQEQVNASRSSSTSSNTTTSSATRDREQPEVVEVPDNDVFEDPNHELIEVRVQEHFDQRIAWEEEIEAERLARIAGRGAAQSEEEDAKG